MCVCGVCVQEFKQVLFLLVLVLHFELDDECDYIKAISTTWCTYLGDFSVPRCNGLATIESQPIPSIKRASYHQQQ